jgi:hypothetical protein
MHAAAAQARVSTTAPSSISFLAAYCTTLPLPDTMQRLPCGMQQQQQ